MRAFPRNTKLILAGAIALAGTMAVPAATTMAAENGIHSPLISYDLDASLLADEQIVDAPLRVDAPIREDAGPASTSRPAIVAADANGTLDPQLECIAKVVHHEAANQSRQGQLAVAQLIMNRTQSGRFPATPCGVANQPRQFFPTAGYSPRKDGRWALAVEVAREALNGQTADVIPGAVFYHAAYQSPTSWFRTRTRVATLGDHIFYR